MDRKFNKHAVRKLRGDFSFRDFGKLVGVSRTAVYLWENGETMPNMAAIEKMMTAFGVDESYFFEDAP